MMQLERRQGSVDQLQTENRTLQEQLASISSEVGFDIVFCIVLKCCPTGQGDAGSESSPAGGV